MVTHGTSSRTSCSTSGRSRVSDSGVAVIAFIVAYRLAGCRHRWPTLCTVHATALLTDHYELTMVQAALRSGTADRRSVFEMFARRLPEGRRYGVVAGTGRLLDALEAFRFGDEELAELAHVVDGETLEA